MRSCGIKRGASHTWAYDEKELNSRVSAVAKRKKITKIGRVFLPFILRFLI